MVLERTGLLCGEIDMDNKEQKLAYVDQTAFTFTLCEFSTWTSVDFCRYTHTCTQTTHTHAHTHTHTLTKNETADGIPCYSDILEGAKNVHFTAE